MCINGKGGSRDPVHGQRRALHKPKASEVGLGACLVAAGAACVGGLGSGSGTSLVVRPAAGALHCVGSPATPPRRLDGTNTPPDIPTG